MVNGNCGANYMCDSACDLDPPCNAGLGSPVLAFCIFNDSSAPRTYRRVRQSAPPFDRTSATGIPQGRNPGRYTTLYTYNMGRRPY